MKKKKPHHWRGLAVPPCWASGSITGSLSWELIYRGIKTSWALEPSAVPGSLPGHPSRGSGPQSGLPQPCPLLCSPKPSLLPLLCWAAPILHRPSSTGQGLAGAWGSLPLLFLLFRVSGARVRSLLPVSPLWIPAGCSCLPSGEPLPSAGLCSGARSPCLLVRVPLQPNPAVLTCRNSILGKAFSLPPVLLLQRLRFLGWICRSLARGSERCWSC